MIRTAVPSVKIGFGSDTSAAGCILGPLPLEPPGGAVRRRVVVPALVLALLAPHASAEDPPQPRPGASHAVPLYGELLHGFDAPEDDPFAPGHRGLDVGAPAGSAVRASAPGVVSFAGVVAGNRTVTLDHGGGLRTSYSYLATSAVRAGASVARGEIVGTVGAGHPGSGLPPHVHLSSRQDGTYLDPLRLYVGSGYADLLSLVG
jgi:murein DD-endopeptidase MepM/ murein hydrolase activator NlpD